MNLTKKKVKQIIQEELKKAIGEQLLLREWQVNRPPLSGKQKDGKECTGDGKETFYSSHFMGCFLWSQPGSKSPRNKNINLFTACEEGQVRQRKDGFWYKNCQDAAKAGWKDYAEAESSIFESKMPLLQVRGEGGSWYSKGAVWDVSWIKDSDDETNTWTKKGDVVRGGPDGKGLGRGHRRFLGMSLKWLTKKRGYLWNNGGKGENNPVADLIKMRNKKYCFTKTGTKANPYRGAYYDDDTWVFEGESAKWSPKRKIRHAKRAARACTIVNPSLRASYPKYSKWADKNKAAMKKCAARGGTWDKKGRKCVGKKPTPDAQKRARPTAQELVSGTRLAAGGGPSVRMVAHAAALKDAASFRNLTNDERTEFRKNVKSGKWKLTGDWDQGAIDQYQIQLPVTKTRAERHISDPETLPD